ncbi:T-cell receptor beta chain ANA 11, putative [Brugia malayi]|uniref:Bm10338 n=1 Tax=Brugia malayi TaxID=6279 RepID=A0A0K0IMW9_BRUMA|nr:T-cell receptor beta chain ANA 11, putative [Brugia malayi]CRZ24825.1 Bm10338 [Brugia malayi]VIO93157.1 T-cell receptor beta chain ANA 11, putative [Brugia malayi]
MINKEGKYMSNCAHVEIRHNANSSGNRKHFDKKKRKINSKKVSSGVFFNDSRSNYSKSNVIRKILHIKLHFSNNDFEV